MSKTVIFDFDGTIARSLEMMVGYFNEIAPKYELSPIRESEYDNLRNLSARELLTKFNVPLWKSVSLAKDIQALQKRDSAKVPIVEGMADVLQKLKKRGIELGIVTSNTVENVEVFLHTQGITEMSFVHAEKNIFGKGAVLKHAIKDRKLTKAETIYVGDEVRDIDAAHEAGISMIAVTWGLNTKDRLELAKPEYVVDEPSELTKIIS